MDKHFKNHLIFVGEVPVASLHKEELLYLLHNYEYGPRGDGPLVMATVYSEFLYHALRDPGVRRMLGETSVNLVDGVGVLWAERFLNMPFSASNYWWKIVEGVFQLLWVLILLLLHRHAFTAKFPEIISGSTFVFDLCELAVAKKWSVFLVGGFGDTPEKAAAELKKRFSGLVIAGTSNLDMEDPALLEQVSGSGADVVMVAFGPIRQEQWSLKNVSSLQSAKVLIGLGGTFDYLAGTRKSPPKIVSSLGFEWLFRLVTQPWRFKRIFNSTFGLGLALLRYKVFLSMPFRQNVVSIIRNNKGEFFVADRKHSQLLTRNTLDKPEHYWQFPQGGLDEGEDVVAGAFRETMEETGLKSLKVVGVSKEKNSYIWPNGRRPLLVSTHYRFKGQEQYIVYFQFEGDDLEVNLDNFELVAWQWIKLDHLEVVVHPDKYSLVEILKNDIALGMFD